MNVMALLRWNGLTRRFLNRSGPFMAEMAGRQTDHLDSWGRKLCIWIFHTMCCVIVLYNCLPMAVEPTKKELSFT